MVWEGKQNHVKHQSESLWKKGVEYSSLEPYIPSEKWKDFTFCAARSGVHMTSRIQYWPGWLFMGISKWQEHRAILQPLTKSTGSQSIMGILQPSCDSRNLRWGGAFLHHYNGCEHKPSRRAQGLLRQDFLKRKDQGVPQWSSSQDTELSQPRAQVQPLAWELRSHQWQGIAKKKERSISNLLFHHCPSRTGSKTHFYSPN